ncbi:MAG: ATPase, T2SS/T4P/T4SS family, partial [Polyangiales bacterium]
MSTAVRIEQSSFVLQVVIESGSSRSTRTLTVEGALLIGRDAEAGLCLDDDLVSRRHAIVRADGAALEVEDVSSNGTLVDGAPLRRARRSVGEECVVCLGASKLTLRRERALPESPFVPLVVVNPEHELNELRRSIHRSLLQQLDLSAFDPLRRDDPTLRPRVLAALRRIVAQRTLPAGASADALVGEMADEALGLGPLEHLLADPQVTEIMVVDPTTIYVERAGKLTLSDRRFTDDERVRAVIERIVTPLGRRVDESSPLVDARLPDGSRVNIIIRPLALRGSCIT